MSVCPSEGGGGGGVMILIQYAPRKFVLYDTHGVG